MKKHIQQVTCARCPAQVERAWDEPGDLPEGWGQVEVHGARAARGAPRRSLAPRTRALQAGLETNLNPLLRSRIVEVR